MKENGSTTKLTKVRRRWYHKLAGVKEIWLVDGELNYIKIEKSKKSYKDFYAYFRRELTIFLRFLLS